MGESDRELVVHGPDLRVGVDASVKDQANHHGGKWIDEATSSLSSNQESKLAAATFRNDRLPGRADLRTRTAPLETQSRDLLLQFSRNC